MNDTAIRQAVVQTALLYLPPTMRESVCDDAGFRERYLPPGDYILRLQNDAASFRRSALTRAVRLVLAGAWEKKLPDTGGRRWKLRSRVTRNGPPALLLSRGPELRQLPLSFGTLSPDRSARLQLLRDAESALNLPIDRVKHWHDILEDRPLNDDELVEYLNDVFDTPVDTAMTLSDTVRAGGFNIAALVPSSRRYFRRLVGEYDGSSTVHAYAAGTGKSHLEALCRWNPSDGFIHGLYLASDPALTSCLSVEQTDRAQFASLLQRVRDSGDRMSQVGALEVGLRVLSRVPEIATILEELVEFIRDDDATGSNSNIVLLSSLFRLVDGQLSRTKLFSREEPYYRRLAAFAHSAILHGAILDSPIDREQFIDWACGDNRVQSTLQDYIDMRTEPYWNLHLAAPTQLKAQLVGRILLAANHFSESLEDHEKLRNLLVTLPACLTVDNKDQSLGMVMRGPLDGRRPAVEKPPASVDREIRKRLNSEEVTPSSFVPFANAALLYDIDDDLAALAATRLRRVSFELHDKRSAVVSIVLALAVAAAVCRSTTLADAVRDLALRHVADDRPQLSLAEKLDVVLTLSATRSDETEWARSVGGTLEQLAFNDLEKQERQLLHSYIRQLCQLKPELWTYCARADAAVASLGGVA